MICLPTKETVAKLRAMASIPQKRSPVAAASQAYILPRENAVDISVTDIVRRLTVTIGEESPQSGYPASTEFWPLYTAIKGFSSPSFSMTLKEGRVELLSFDRKIVIPTSGYDAPFTAHPGRVSQRSVPPSFWSAAAVCFRSTYGDETRPGVSSIVLHEGAFYAMDGYRFAKAPVYEIGSESLALPRSSVQSLLLLPQLGESWHFSHKERRIFLESGRLAYWSSATLSLGDPMPQVSVISSLLENSPPREGVVVDADAVRKACRNVKALVPGEEPLVIDYSSGALRLCRSVGGYSYEDTIVPVVESTQPSFRLGVHPSRLLDVISSAKGAVSLWYDGKPNPLCLLLDNEAVSGVMTMLLDEDKK